MEYGVLSVLPLIFLIWLDVDPARAIK